jgi:hypothetical protein
MSEFEGIGEGHLGGGDAGSVDPAPPSSPPASNDHAPEPAARPSMDETIGKAFDRPARNGNGQFAAKPKPIDAPHSWSQQLRDAHWANLHPELQRYVAQREAEAHRTITGMGTQAKALEPYERVVTHFGADFAARGLEPAQAFHVLANAQRELDRNPKQAISYLMQSYGLSPGDFLDHKQSTRVSELERQLVEANRELSSSRAHREAELKDFAKRNPHFERVRDVMASLMQLTTPEGYAKYPTLEIAYQAACAADPTISGQVQAQQRKSEEAKREEEARRKAAEAQKAARVNVRSGSHVFQAPKTMDETIRDLARKHYG